VLVVWDRYGSRRSFHFKDRAEAREVQGVESWIPRGLPQDATDISLVDDAESNFEDGSARVSSCGQASWRARLTTMPCSKGLPGECFRETPKGANSCLVVAFVPGSDLVRFRNCERQ
jgi:hypothetical protein